MANHRPGSRHSQHSQGQNQSCDCRQTLRNGGHCQTDPCLDHQPEPVPSPPPGDRHHASDSQHQPDQSSSQFVQPLLERGRLFLRLGHQLSDAAQFCLATRRCDDPHSSSRDDRGPQVEHRSPLRHRSFPLDRFHPFGHGGTLSRQACLFDPQPNLLQQSRIRRDSVPRADHDNISRHQLPGLDDLLPPLSPYPCPERDLPPQRFQRSPRLPLRQKPNPCIDPQYHQNRDTLSTPSSPPGNPGGPHQ